MILENVRIDGKLCSVTISGDKIQKIEEMESGAGQGGFDAHGLTALPGLIDIHTHGRMGIDSMDADFGALAAHYAAVGTTSFLATTMTEPFPELKRVNDAALSYMESPSDGACLLGIHFEGPYISPERSGAQDPAAIALPCAEQLSQLSCAKMMTIAPELRGSLKLIKETGKDVIFSLGHTDCTHAEALAAIDAGAQCLTHIYNAMPPVHHRQPGPVGAAFDRQIYVQLICDGAHVSGSVVGMTFRLFPGRVILISDSIKPAGFSSGCFNCGGLDVVLNDGKACLADGRFAGSTASLLQCVRKACEFGIPLQQAVDAASLIPARLLGLNKGALLPGYDADIILVDDRLELKHVIIGGRFYTDDEH